MRAMMLLLLAAVATAAPLGQGSYRYLSYNEIVLRMQQLAASNPDLMTLSTAKQDFQLPTAGQCGSEPCQVWIMRLGTPDAPRVFISGALHGNERVGAVTALELAAWLLNSKTDPWVARMLATRSIVIMPMPNAVGFFQDVRTELSRDPNRDFAFDQSPSECMTTLTARSINEVYIEKPRQPVLITVTFHGGDNMIGWPWGDTAHGRRSKSPDQISMELIGSRMRDWAGRVKGAEGKYKVGTMTDAIYAVQGGMEDWAYGASWEKRIAVNCNSKGYSKSRTVYTDAALRSMVFLVETAMSKKPPERTLGGPSGLLFPASLADGHVPRNIRLALQAIDIVQPYVVLDRVAAAATVQPGASVQLQWRVGGALEVGTTQIEERIGHELHKWSKVGDALEGGRAAPTLSCGSISSTECVQWGGRQYSASVTARVELAGSKWCLRAVALNVDKSWASGESHIGRQRRAKELKRVVSSEICIQVKADPDPVAPVKNAESQWVEPAIAPKATAVIAPEPLVTPKAPVVVPPAVRTFVEDDGIGLGMGEDVETSHLAGQTAKLMAPDAAPMSYGIRNSMRRPGLEAPEELAERAAPGAAGRHGVTMLQYGEMFLGCVGVLIFIAMLGRVKLRSSRVTL